MERKRLLLIIVVLVLIALAVYVTRFKDNVGLAPAIYTCVFEDGKCGCPIDNPNGYNECEGRNELSCNSGTCGSTRVGPVEPLSGECKCTAPDSYTETFINQFGVKVTNRYTLKRLDDNCKTHNSFTCGTKTCTGHYSFLSGEQTISKKYPCALS
jgi:hypothetical protein